MRRIGTSFVAAFLFATGLVSVGASANVAIVDRQGTQLNATQYRFVDEAGNTVSLDNYFHHGRPVLLMPVYFGCPGICTVSLNNLVTSLKLVNPSPGHGFEMLVVSIDPREGPEMARAKKQAYLKLYNRIETANGWHFLTGDWTNISGLTQALGFEFERDEKTGLINHPSALYVLSPDGKLTSTFAAIKYPHRELRAALFEAQEGRVQALANRLSSFCYAYLPHSGVISFQSRLAALGAVLTAIGLAIYGARSYLFAHRK